MNNTSPTIQYRRSPWTAAILSLIMPGLGQVYVGTLARGLVWMFLCGIFSVTGLLFVYPDDRRIFYIKRVVAIAGDRVEVKSGNLYVNGVELPRESIGPATTSSDHTTSTGEVFYENNNGARYRIFISPQKPAADFGPITVPKYDCFVMGDNRNDSRDSRHFGPIAVTSLKGKFEYRYWPIIGGAHWGTIQ